MWWGKCQYIIKYKKDKYSYITGEHFLMSPNVGKDKWETNVDNKNIRDQWTQLLLWWQNSLKSINTG